MNSRIFPPAVFLLLLATVSPVAGQTILGPEGPVNPAHKATPSGGPNDPIIYRLSVTPAPEPNPPLKYSLYPRLSELKPGNSVPFWYRAIDPISPPETNPRLKPYHENFERWTTESLSEMPVDEIRPFLENMQDVFAEAHTAAYREETNWDLRLQDLRGPESIAIHLEEFQVSRMLERLLSLRTRFSVREGNVDEALSDLAVSFRLARDIAEPETLINSLIGLAICGMAQDDMLALIGSPGSPNLYWALAGLPRPLIDIRHAVEMEMTLPERVFPWLKDPVAENRTAGEWQQILSEALRDITGEFRSPPLPATEGTSDSTMDVILLGLALRNYPTVKQDLIASGYSAEQLADMSVGQAVALNQKLTYQTLWQNYQAALLLPVQIGQMRLAGLESRFGTEDVLSLPGGGRETIPISATLLPSVRMAQLAPLRRDCMTAALMTVEAIRMHLAATKGRLPQTQEEIQVVPAMNNPWTGAPFPYELHDGTAVLELAMPDFYRRFEIRVDPGSAH